MRNQISGAITLDASSLAEIIADAVASRLAALQPLPAGAPLTREQAFHALLELYTDATARSITEHLYSNGLTIAALPQSTPLTSPSSLEHPEDSPYPS